MEKIQIKHLEPIYYLGRSGKGLITSLGFRIIRRSNKIKKARFAITEVSLKYILRLLRNYASKRSKHMPTDSYLYLAIQLAECIMSNLHAPVRTQTASMQNMSDYKMST